MALLKANPIVRAVSKLVLKAFVNGILGAPILFKSLLFFVKKHKGKDRDKGGIESLFKTTRPCFSGVVCGRECL